MSKGSPPFAATYAQTGRFPEAVEVAIKALQSA